jgi:hypothetical protein
MTALLLFVSGMLSLLPEGVEVHPNGARLTYTLRVLHPGTLRVLLPGNLDTARLALDSRSVVVLTHRWVPVPYPDTLLPDPDRAYARLERQRTAIQDSLHVLALEESLRVQLPEKVSSLSPEMLQSFRPTLFSLYRLRRRLEAHLKQVQDSLKALQALRSVPTRRAYRLLLVVQGRGSLTLRCWTPDASLEPGLVLQGRPFSPSITLRLAARVSQQTGFLWDHVQAVLDTRPRTEETPGPAPKPQPWWGFIRTGERRAILAPAPSLTLKEPPPPTPPRESGFSLRIPVRSLTLPSGGQRRFTLAQDDVSAHWFIEVRRFHLPHVALTLTQPFPYALPEGFLDLEIEGFPSQKGFTPAWGKGQDRTFWLQPLPEVPFLWERTSVHRRNTRDHRVVEEVYRARLINPYGTPRTFRILLPEPPREDREARIQDLRWTPRPDSLIQHGTARFGVWWKKLEGGDSLIIHLRVKTVRPR